MSRQYAKYCLLPTYDCLLKIYETKCLSDYVGISILRFTDGNGQG